ncbi:MAG TPA: hypothetical protein VK112_10395 [Fodinibius sp.]|nr:hypothetical protein [Fodinibius sp.]
MKRSTFLIQSGKAMLVSTLEGTLNSLAARVSGQNIDSIDTTQ